MHDKLLAANHVYACSICHTIIKWGSLSYTFKYKYDYLLTFLPFYFVILSISNVFAGLWPHSSGIDIILLLDMEVNGVAGRFQREINSFQDVLEVGCIQIRASRLEILILSQAMLTEMKAQKQLLKDQDRDLQEKRDLIALYLRERNEARGQIQSLKTSRLSERVSMKCFKRTSTEGKNRKIRLLWC